MPHFPGTLTWMWGVIWKMTIVTTLPKNRSRWTTKWQKVLWLSKTILIKTVSWLWTNWSPTSQYRGAQKLCPLISAIIDSTDGRRWNHRKRKVVRDGNIIRGLPNDSDRYLVEMAPLGRQTNQADEYQATDVSCQLWLQLIMSSFLSVPTKWWINKLFFLKLNSFFWCSLVDWLTYVRMTRTRISQYHH